MIRRELRQYEDTHRSHTKTRKTAGFIGFNLVPMDDRFVQKTQSGEETLSNCDAGVLRRVQLEPKFHVVQEGKQFTRLFFQHN